jgi:hypothetical protein
MTLNDGNLPDFSEKHRDLGNVALCLETLGARAFRKKELDLASTCFVSLVSARWKQRAGNEPTRPLDSLKEAYSFLTESIVHRDPAGSHSGIS